MDILSFIFALLFVIAAVFIGVIIFICIVIWKVLKGVIDQTKKPGE